MEQGGLAEGLRGSGCGHGSEVCSERRCGMDVVIQVLTLLVSSGIVGQLLYYNSRKRKEAAAAQKDEDANAMAYAQEWKKLYEHEHDEHLTERKSLNGKIDSLFDELNRQRAQIRQLKDEKNDMMLRMHELEWNECRVNGCMKRQPPRDYGAKETD